MRPIAADLQALGQVPKIDLVQYLLHTRLILGLPHRRVGNDRAQVPQRQIGTLRQEQRLMAQWAPHLPFGIGPQAGQGA